jgi:hypothetical protein
VRAPAAGQVEVSSIPPAVLSRAPIPRHICVVVAVAVVVVVVVFAVVAVAVFSTASAAALEAISSPARAASSLRPV